MRQAEKHQAMPFKSGKPLIFTRVDRKLCAAFKADAQFDNLYFDAVNCFAYDDSSLISFIAKSLMT